MTAIIAGNVINSLNVQLARNGDFLWSGTNQAGHWATGDLLELRFYAVDPASMDNPPFTSWSAILTGAIASWQVPKASVQAVIDASQFHAGLFYTDSSGDEVEIALGLAIVDSPNSAGMPSFSLSTNLAAPTVVFAPVAGPQGPAAGAVTMTAGATLSGHRLVTQQPDGTAIYADATNPTHVNVPLWLTLDAAAMGASVTVQEFGIVTEPSWSWTPGPLYLGATGLLTQTVPTAPAFLVQVGYATSATSITLDRQPSLVLA